MSREKTAGDSNSSAAYPLSLHDMHTYLSLVFSSLSFCLSCISHDLYLSLALRFVVSISFSLRRRSAFVSLFQLLFPCSVHFRSVCSALPLFFSSSFSVELLASSLASLGVVRRWAFSFFLW